MIGTKIQLSNILKLSFKNTLYFVNNYNDSHLLKMIKYQKIIANLTEQACITNVLFNFDN